VSEHLDDIIYVQLASGVSGAEGKAAIESIVDGYPTANVLDLDQFKQQQIDEINRFLAVIYRCTNEPTSSACSAPSG
jgi:hypothetical protein